MIEGRAQEWLRAARRVAVLTGAGVSAESGVPTFRDAQSGVWARFEPSELATPEAFARNPEKVWAWYAWRRKLAGEAAPNPAHRALAEWEPELEWLRIITQNVDGLHQQAGSRTVIELHGNIHRNRCGRGHRFDYTPEDEAVPPRCPECGERLRPDVVWFGEMLPEGAVEAAIEAIQGADLVLSVGTSSLVQPAASLPLEAKERNVPVIEVNVEPTPLTPVAELSLRGKAGEVVPELVAAARSL